MKSTTRSDWKLYAICSQAQSEANLARTEWNLFGYTSVVGDNENVIVRYIHEHYICDLVVTDCSKKSGPMSIKHYPHGAVQPAFAFFVGKEPAILWACQPSVANLQGSVGRPKPELVWKVVLQCKKKHDNGEAFESADGGELEKSGSCGEALFKTCCTVS